MTLEDEKRAGDAMTPQDSTPQTWRTVADDGPPDPSEHEWVLWRRAGDPTALWRPAQAQHIQDEPMYDWDDGEWAPFTPPSAPAPPPRWTVGQGTLGRAPELLRDGQRVNVYVLADELNAADRHDTGGTCTSTWEDHRCQSPVSHGGVHRDGKYQWTDDDTAAPPADGVVEARVTGARVRLDTLTAGAWIEQLPDDCDTWEPLCSADEAQAITEVAAALGLVDTGDGFDVAGLRAWLVRMADSTLPANDDYSRGVGTAYRYIAKRIDGAFGTVTADPPMRPMDELPDGHDTVLIQRADGQRECDLETCREYDKVRGFVGWWPLDDAPAVPTVEADDE